MKPLSFPRTQSPSGHVRITRLASLLLALVLLLVGGKNPTVHANLYRPVTGLAIQIPVIQVSDGWETWIRIQNVGQKDTKFALLLFDYFGPYSGSYCGFPTMVELSGRVPVGGAWTYRLASTNTLDCNGAPFRSTSGILVSLSMTQASYAEQLACLGPGLDVRTYMYDLWLNWMEYPDVIATGLPGIAHLDGEPTAVHVDRIRTGTGGTPLATAYTGIAEPEMEIGPDSRTGAYMYYTPLLFDAFNSSGWSSQIWIQNFGTECTSVEIWFQRQQDCLKARVQQVLSLCPGETVAVDPEMPGFLGSAWIRSTQPLGIIVDEYNANSNLLMSYRGMPANYYGALTTSGSLFNYAPLIYRELNGWNTSIVVQNLSGVHNALVKVYFLDNNGDIIDTIVEWLCPRGSQVFYLPQISDLPGQYVGQARVESQNWWGPGSPSVPAPNILSVVHLVNYNTGQGDSYNAFPAHQALNVQWVALPSLVKDKRDPYEPTGTRWSSEIAMTDLDMIPHVSTWRIDFFDQNGLLYSLCQTLSEKQVIYIKLANIGILPPGWVGSAIISWQCGTGGALGVVVVEKASGYPSGDLTKAYGGFPLFIPPTLPDAVRCPDCMQQLCDSVTITGKVTNAGVALAGATVELWSYGPNNVWNGATDFVGAGDDYLYATTTSSSVAGATLGDYTFVNVAAAPLGQNYYVIASKTGYVGTFTAVSNVLCGVDRTININPCIVVINGTAHVTPFNSGAALKNATVELWQWDATLTPPAYKSFASTTTNSEGFFEFVAQPCGTYELKFLFLCVGNTVTVIKDGIVLDPAQVSTWKIEVDLNRCEGRWFK